MGPRMLSPLSRVLLVCLVGLCSLVGLLFWRRQNVNKAQGGRISPPKLAWLLYAVFVWFLLCPLVASEAGLHPHLRWVLGGFAAFMWARGGAELYMLYVTRNWRPPYGITHDALSLALVLGGLGGYALRRDAPPTSLDLWALCLLGLVTVTLVIEILYAALFFHAVEGRTTGEDGIWFADEEQARFQRINRITFACNVPLYASLTGLLAVGWGLGG